MGVIVQENKVLQFFDSMNKRKIEYVLLRNIDNELPNNYGPEKDIDILVKKESKKDFHMFMKDCHWIKVRHPWDFGSNFVFLYAMDRLEFFEKEDIHLDVCYQLCCRSVNNGEWMPVDMIIQDSVWQNRRRNSEYPWYEMSEEDQLLHLLTRCVLDKKKFPDGYKKEIQRLLPLVDLEVFMSKLNVVFFNFSKRLVQMLNSGFFDDIPHEYLTFVEY